jgi:hypothetical protein
MSTFESLPKGIFDQEELTATWGHNCGRDRPNQLEFQRSYRIPALEMGLFLVGPAITITCTADAWFRTIHQIGTGLATYAIGEILVHIWKRYLQIPSLYKFATPSFPGQAWGYDIPDFEKAFWSLYVEFSNQAQSIIRDMVPHRKFEKCSGFLLWQKGAVSQKISDNVPAEAC